MQIGDSIETVIQKLIDHGIDTSSLVIKQLFEGSPTIPWRLWSFRDTHFLGRSADYELVTGRGRVTNIKVWLEEDNNETFEFLRTLAKKSFTDTIEVWNFLGDSGTLVAAQDSIIDVMMYTIHRDSLGPRLPLIVINSNARTISGIKPKPLKETYGNMRWPIR